jgi:uncharacterized protein (TIGR03083 family)
VGQVYAHKVRVMADEAWPDPWPPADVLETAERDPAGFLADAKAELFAEFSRHQLEDPAVTFSADDRTIAFWVRRMALEIAVHRYDAELAHDKPTPIADDLATDGIDEMLRVMLAGPWWESRVVTKHPLDASVAVEAGGRRWLCRLTATSVTVVEDPGAPAEATVSGSSPDVFLWLWGRVPDERVTIDGDRDVAGGFRGRLSECSG